MRGQNGRATAAVQRQSREKGSFRQIDGDEGRLEIPPILIATHDCSV